MKNVWDELKWAIGEALELSFIGIASIAIALFYIVIVCAPIALVFAGIYKIAELIISR